jgi:hypothetical protein
MGGFRIMTKVKTFTVGLPVTDLKSAVEWYRRLLGEVEEVFDQRLGDLFIVRVAGNELKRIWPPDDKDREAKIANFAQTYGLRLRFYRKGLCAIFAKPKQNRLRP